MIEIDWNMKQTGGLINIRGVEPSESGGANHLQQNHWANFAAKVSVCAFSDVHLGSGIFFLSLSVPFLTFLRYFFIFFPYISTWDPNVPCFVLFWFLKTFFWGQNKGQHGQMASRWFQANLGIQWYPVISSIILLMGARRVWTACDFNLRESRKPSPFLYLQSPSRWCLEVLHQSTRMIRMQSFHPELQLARSRQSPDTSTSRTSNGWWLPVWNIFDA